MLVLPLNYSQRHFLVGADVTNVEAELLKNAAGDPGQVAELQARIKELEMEQSLMQRELDNMSDVAQRTDNQLRLLLSKHCLICLLLTFPVEQICLNPPRLHGISVLAVATMVPDLFWLQLFQDMQHESPLSGALLGGRTDVPCTEWGQP